VLGRGILFLSLGLAGCTILHGQVVSSGTIEIPGTDTFDFDAGALVNLSPFASADVFWHLGSATTRDLEPANLAGIVNLGSSVSFSSLTAAQLAAQTYCLSGAGFTGFSCGINGSNIGSTLVVGDVFAVQTNLGNFAKAVVTAPLDPAQNNGLIIQWVTYANPGPPATPAPPSFLLVVTGLLGAVGFYWRKALRTG
jgi:hypothetical protein